MQSNALRVSDASIPRQVIEKPSGPILLGALP